MSGFPWTTKDDFTLTEWYEQGADDKMIAGEIGRQCTWRQVEFRRRWLGLGFQTAMRDGGKFPKKYTDEDIKLVIEMTNQEQSSADIAKALTVNHPGMTEGMVDSIKANIRLKERNSQSPQLSRYDCNYTKEEHQLVKRLYHEGQSDEVIATALQATRAGINASAVASYRRNHKIDYKRTLAPTPRPAHLTTDTKVVAQPAQPKPVSKYYPPKPSLPFDPAAYHPFAEKPKTPRDPSPDEELMVEVEGLKVFGSPAAIAKFARNYNNAKLRG